MKRIILIAALVLAGCTDRFQINDPSISDAYKTCNQHDGLRFIDVGEQHIHATCMNDRVFTTRKRPDPKKEKQS